MCFCFLVFRLVVKCRVRLFVCLSEGCKGKRKGKRRFV